MRRTTLNIFMLSVIVMLLGCSRDGTNSQGESNGSNSVTQYNPATELFMEYPMLVVGQEAKFLIHLTDLKDFKAVMQGSLDIEFKNETGTIVRVSEGKPARAGIFIPTVKFDSPGKYFMTMRLAGAQVSDKIAVEDVIVYGSAGDIPQEGESAGPKLISFLKEQQWKIDFATVPVQKRLLQPSVPATGEIIAKPEYYSKVVSPVAGILMAKNNSGFPKPGTAVKSGDVLFNISPSADAGANIQRIKSDYLLAKAEFERVQSLLEKKAVSQRRFDEAKFDFESKQASYNSLTDQIRFTENGYAIVSPIDGFVESVSVSLGSQIQSGQEIVTIINPKRLVLRANVPSSKFDEANNATDASFRIEGYGSELRISGLNGRKLSVGSSLTGESRSVPVYFEFDNTQNRIKAGMYAEVFIKTGSRQELLAIPESAVVDEDAMHTAYVQVEGEGFEKRIIRTGISDGGYIQVLEGLKEGERVVTKGAYQVRLAALSPESAIGQGHVH